MASIIKRGKTYSVVHYEGKGKDRHQVWESGLSYTAAKSRKAQIEHEEKEKNNDDGNDQDKVNEMTVSEFIYEFIDKYGRKKWVASTYDGNVGLLENYVHPYLGDKKLKSIKTKTVDNYYHFLETEAEPATNMGKPMRDHVSPSTIHDIHKVLRCAFNLAVRWEYIKDNPFLKATLPDHKETPREVLEPEQILRVLKFCCKPESYDHYLIHCAILIAIGCTIREGEIGGLQWNNVNFDKFQFRIDRTIDRVKKKNLNLPKMKILYKFPNLYPGASTVIALKQLKNDDMIRDVDVPQSVMNALDILKSLQEKLKNELGPEGYSDYDLLICQANGRPMMTEHINKRFKELLREMNDPEIDPEKYVFHSLRHTSATAKLIMSNGDYNSVMQAGGWANLEMLTRRYGKHSFTSDRERMAEKMNQFLDGKMDEPNTDTNNTQIMLESLLKSNPDLLIQLVRAIQSANT